MCEVKKSLDRCISLYGKASLPSKEKPSPLDELKILWMSDDSSSVEMRFFASFYIAKLRTDDKLSFKKHGMISADRLLGTHNLECLNKVGELTRGEDFFYTRAAELFRDMLAKEGSSQFLEIFNNKMSWEKDLEIYTLLCLIKCAPKDASSLKEYLSKKN
jgi:hypothetical protein